MTHSRRTPEMQYFLGCAAHCWVPMRTHFACWGGVGCWSPFFRSPNPPTSMFRVFSSQSHTHTHPHHRFQRTDGRAGSCHTSHTRSWNFSRVVEPTHSTAKPTATHHQQPTTSNNNKKRTYHRPPFVLCFSCCSTRCTQKTHTDTHTLTNTTRGLGTRFCTRFIHAHTPHALIIIIIAPVAPITTTRQHANTETDRRHRLIGYPVLSFGRHHFFLVICHLFTRRNIKSSKKNGVPILVRTDF